ncbi:mitochondrial processing peptidase [Citrus sinensis]|uniref:Mitochondrial processing peptidase n=1 Tax=Citrus sinensis TaxID=2711 RepID=A0ACB8J997_CITSI|nr:mitochondrial processing peptidase [Citrus sinensis]
MQNGHGEKSVWRRSIRAHSLRLWGQSSAVVPGQIQDLGLLATPTLLKNVLRAERESFGRLGNFQAMRYATSGAAAVRPSSPGFFSWLTGEQSSSLPSLDTPLEGVSFPPSLPDFVEPGKVKVTTLENGIRIASETSVSPAASIGLYLDCGSVYETPSSCGASNLLEKMAFKSTKNRSHLRIVREVEAIGGSILASASREQMGYSFDALKTYVPEMVELLVDCVRNPVFLDWEVNEELRKLKSELGELHNNPQGLLLEAIHSTGYAGALGNPLLAPESALNRLDGTILEEFVAENFTAPRMVLAASGVDLNELLPIAEPLLSDLPRLPPATEPKSVYIGGDYRQQADSPETHIALAFEVPGGWLKDKEAIILTVLQVLMGGGGSFSAGGPGKGMHTRLYLRVLNEYQQIQSFSAFNSIFNNTGLFGIYACTGSDFVSKAVDLVVRELILIATPKQVTQVQLNRAKEATKSAVLMNLESRVIVSEDIGRQILTYGERKSVDQFLSVLEHITLDDITNIAQKIISSPLTMASYGDVINVPGYESVSSKFHAK